LAYLEGCSACTHDHQVDGCITCDSVSHVDQSPPSLVAGIHLSNPVGLRRPQSKPKSKPSNLAGKLAPAIATSTTTKLIDPQS
jgi:hypothetical protein